MHDVIIVIVVLDFFFLMLCLPERSLGTLLESINKIKTSSFKEEHLVLHKPVGALRYVMQKRAQVKLGKYKLGIS